MPGMKPSLADKLARADDRLVELDALLAQPEIAGDMDSFRKLSRERAELDPVVTLYRQYRQLEADQKTAQELLADPDVRALLEAPRRQAERLRAKLGAVG